MVPRIETRTYRVPGMHCAHCTSAVERGLAAVPGVARASADLATGVVTVAGEGLSDETLVAAIEEAGYEVEARQER